MRLKLLFNPAAGRGRTRRFVESAAARLRERGATVEMTPSRSPAHLTELAAAASREEYDRVVVCGGDGTLHLAVREFDLVRGTLGLIPLGSGDDFARVLGIPRDAVRAADVVIDGVERRVDVATANDRRYLGVAGVGFDSEVARQAQTVKVLRGSLVYLYAILRVLPRFRPHRIHLEIDNQGREDEVMFAVVANSSQYGAGIRIAPDALVDDELLDYCLVHRCSRVKLLKTLPQAYTGKHVTSDVAETGRGREIRITSERPLDVFADGELLTTSPVTFGLAKEKLRIVVPTS
jgi:YegS/Rv2252/BmrU family lipid kinase